VSRRRVAAGCGSNPWRSLARDIQAAALVTTTSATLALFATGEALADDSLPAWFQPTGQLQIWATVYDQDEDVQADPAGYGDPEDDPGFKIRRARLGAEGELGHGMFYEVVFGARSPYDAWVKPDSDIGLVDASFGWQHDSGFSVAAGQQKLPYSREALISSRELALTERGVATEHMVPDRETGLVLAYDFGKLGVSAGAFNGSGSFIGDDNMGMLEAARLEFSTGEEGQDYQTYGKVEGFVFAMGANQFYNADLSTGTMSFGGDMLMRVAGLALLVEGHYANIKPTATDVASPDVMDGTPRFGGLAQLGYTIGPVESALRLSLYDDDTAVDDNGDVLEIYGGSSWHFAEDHGLLGAGYVARIERGGRTLPNDTIRVWGQVKF